MKNLGRTFLTLLIPVIIALNSTTHAQTIKAKDSNSNASLSLSKVNERRGSKSVKAITQDQMEAFRKLLIDPKANPIFLNNIGVRLGAEERNEDAVEFIERATNLAKNVAPYKVNLAIVKIHLGEPDRALELLNEAAAVDPAYTRTQDVLCDLFTTTLRHKEAVECFEERRAKEDELDAVSVSNYSMSLMETGKLKPAVKLLRKAAVLNPDQVGILNALAVGLYRSKEYPECVDVLSKLVNLSPDRPQYRFNLTVALLAAKERDEAIEQYNLLKRSDPKLASEAFKVLFGSRIVDAGDRNRF